MNTQAIARHAALLRQALPGLVELAPGTARRLPAARHGRWLVVVGGRLWLTETASRRQASADLWLGAGDGHRIAAGVEVVVEACPEACFQLVEAVDAVEPVQAGTSAPSRPWFAPWVAALGRAWPPLRPLHAQAPERCA